MEQKELQKQAVYEAIRVLGQAGIHAKIMRIYGTKDNVGLSLQNIDISDILEVKKAENPLLASCVS